jgi:hypothetical protein
VCACLHLLHINFLAVLASGHDRHDRTTTLHCTPLLAHAHRTTTSSFVHSLACLLSSITRRAQPQLRAIHHAAIKDKSKAQLKWVGLDLPAGTVRDNRKAGVLEPGQSKIKSLKFATEAAITILRIDDMIKMQQQKEGENQYEKAMRDGTLNG